MDENTYKAIKNVSDNVLILGVIYFAFKFMFGSYVKTLKEEGLN